MNEGEKNTKKTPRTTVTPPESKMMFATYIQEVYNPHRFCNRRQMMVVNPNNVKDGLQVHLSREGHPFSPLEIGMVTSVRDDGTRVELNSPHDAESGLELMYDTLSDSFEPGWRVLSQDPHKEPGRLSYGTNYAPIQLEVR